MLFQQENGGECELKLESQKQNLMKFSIFMLRLSYQKIFVIFVFPSRPKSAKIILGLPNSTKIFSLYFLGDISSDQYRQ